MRDQEIEELRDKVHCAVVLERTPPPWQLDRKESTKLSLKYRRGKGEILIVSHGGRGWWDPTSDAKGDVFGLVQRLEPGINFGHVRKRLREFAGLSPSFPIAERAGRRKEFGQIRRRTLGRTEARVASVRRPARYLARKRFLPSTIIDAGLRDRRPAARPSTAAPGSPISTARVRSPMSTFAGRPTKARSPAAPSRSSACRHRDWLQSSRGSSSPRPRSTL